MGGQFKLAHTPADQADFSIALGRCAAQGFCSGSSGTVLHTTQCGLCGAIPHVQIQQLYLLSKQTGSSGATVLHTFGLTGWLGQCPLWCLAWPSLHTMLELLGTCCPELVRHSHCVSYPASVMVCVCYDVFFIALGFCMCGLSRLCVAPCTFVPEQLQ